MPTPRVARRVVVAAGSVLAAAWSEAAFFQSAGRVTDARGIPVEGNVLLDFTLSGDVGDNSWRESIYVRASGGLYRAELGRVNPIPAELIPRGAEIRTSVPAGTGWNVASLPANLFSEAPQPPPAPALPPAVEVPTPSAPVTAAAPVPARKAPPAPAAEKEAIRRLQTELETARAQLESRKASQPGGIYQVQTGDTLESIANKIYGNPERWVDLYKANDDRILRGGDLIPGQRLILPRGEAPVPVRNE